MMNPVKQCIPQNKPFIYFHVHELTEDTIKLAAKARASIEIDVSFDADNNLFVGHHVEYYVFKRLRLPTTNISFDDAVKHAKSKSLFVVIDCKDIRAMNKIEQAIKEIGADNILFHSWLDIFKFEPYPADIVTEPQWKYEDLPANKVLALKQKYDLRIISSARGLTKERLETEAGLVQQIVESCKGKIDCFNFNLPNGQLPSREIIDHLLANDILTLINIDKNKDVQLPDTYIGYTDNLSLASVL